MRWLSLTRINFIFIFFRALSVYTLDAFDRRGEGLKVRGAQVLGVRSGKERALAGKEEEATQPFSDQIRNQELHRMIKQEMTSASEVCRTVWNKEVLDDLG